jgi:hypothetical protein
VVILLRGVGQNRSGGGGACLFENGTKLKEDNRTPVA